MQLNSIDLFCGAGGLTEGLAGAGITARWAIEQDATCVQTFRRAHKQATVMTKRVQDCELNGLAGSIDIIVGGPPCQPFSVHGKQAAAADSRDCIPLFTQAVGIIKPRAFIMENVPGLIAPRHDDYWMARLGEMIDAGYTVHWEVLDAAAYGVPQHRRRLFVVGFRRNLYEYEDLGYLGFRWPEPTHGPGRLPYVTVRDALVWTDSSAGASNNSAVTYARNPVLRPRLINSLIVNGKGRVLDWDAPSPTITAQSSGNGGHVIDFKEELREYHRHLLECSRKGVVPAFRTGTVRGAWRISVEQAARLQGFRDDYPFQGSVSSKYKQIGNAVPPPLAEAVGRAVVEHLKARIRIRIPVRI